MKFNTKTIHGGQSLDTSFNAVMPPIYQTSTYAQSSPGKHKGFEYSRTHNPTRTALQNSFASLENANYGVAFASGLAAIDAIIKLLKPWQCTYNSCRSILYGKQPSINQLSAYCNNAR
jgi:cystathionine beta-lyase